MATTDLCVTEVDDCLPMTNSAVGKIRFICNTERCPSHRPTKRGFRVADAIRTTEVHMRTPSRASIALAMGGIFATTGLTGAAATSAAAATHPSLARPAVAHHTARVLSLTGPGTGLRLSASVDDEGQVEDVDEMENEPEVNDVNDADETETEDEANDAGDQEEAGDDQGGEDNDGADEAGDDQGQDQNDADEADDAA